MRHEMSLRSFLIFAFAITMGPYALASSTWYVDGVHGNDNNNGRSAGAACKTINRAISRSSAGDSIIVAAATYPENLSIGLNLTIVGVNAQTTIIDGRNSASAVTISNPNAHVNLSQLTIRNGKGVTHGGGGIYNVGTTTITNTTISGNKSDDSVSASGGLGGGIYNSGALTLLQSTVSGNNASRMRPGASGLGGGIYNAGRLWVTNTTITANQAVDYWPASVSYGGGIATTSGTVIISNSTISQNTALIHTPYGSPATYGGGIYSKGGSAPALQNSIVANNTSGGNCNGSVASQGHNLSSDLTCNLNGPGDQKNNNPRLGALQNNGGPTNTMALLAGSPATNAGNPSGCTDSSGRRLTVDQRGHSRPSISACDMGAYNH